LQWDGGDGTWGSRPRGLLLATCSEHSGPVNALAVCQDHSFFASASDDCTIKIWPTRGIDREVAVKSLLTYTGHQQEATFSDIESRLSTPGSSARLNRVTDLVILDNTSSIATGSVSGTVHVFRVDLAAAYASKSAAGPSQQNNTAPVNSSLPSARPSIFSGWGRNSSMVPKVGSTSDSSPQFSAPTLPAFPMGSIAERPDQLEEFDADFDGLGMSGVDVDDESFRSRAAYLRTPDGITIARRLVFDVLEGGVAVLRHFDTAMQSVLVVAMVNGVVHGCDLRSRKEIWCARLPVQLGAITALEICPGSTSIVIGTERGCIVVYDTRFNTFISAWRHSARSPIHVIYPYVTLAVRSANLRNDSKSGGAQINVCRQLGVGLGTGEDETSFWSLETGICYRILRSLPQSSHATDAFRVLFFLVFLLLLVILSYRLMVKQQRQPKLQSLQVVQILS
jgi:WD40 repeat protein